MRSLLAVLSVCAVAYGGDTVAAGPSRIASPPAISAWGWCTMGQIAKAQDDMSGGTGTTSSTFQGAWLTNFDVGLRYSQKVGRFSKGRLHVGFEMYFLADQEKTPNYTEFLQKKFIFYIADGALQSCFPLFGGIDTLLTEFGYFPVRYNPQAANLGEYLFRSGTYPGFLLSGFEVADKIKTLGLHVTYKTTAIPGLRNDVYFTNEVDRYPPNDLNLADILSWAPMGLVDVAAGACFAHVISVNPGKTTPGQGGRWNRRMPETLKYVGYVNPADSTDTTLYTFRGTKLMGRMTLDPKWFFPRATFLGTEDLKLYGEVALLGWKNYPGWYEIRRERIPVMFGINFPTFKLLDVLALQAEYYPMKYWNNPENTWKYGSPVPSVTGNGVPYPDDVWEPKTDDDWKWSIYASRKIGPAVRVSCQFASDHIQRSPYLPGPPTFTRYTEIVPRSNDWYWMARVMYMF